MMDVINTVDQAFFGKVMKEYEAASLKQAEKNDKTITLNEEMFDVLKQYADIFQSRTAKAAPSRFNLPPKKRKRRERSIWPELQAQITPSSFAAVQQKRRLLK